MSNQSNVSSVVKKKKKKKEKWTEECEELLAEWSEKASCYRWLHGRCEKSYKNWYYCFSIPVIILSTLTGAANVGMDSFVPQENKSMASAIVGGVNILAGIVSNLQNFSKVAELMEGHRIAGVSWGKLQRNIAIELALDPSRRVLQTDFLKLSRAEYDRLIEAGPLIDDGVIKQFNSKFKNYEVCKPSICNGLDKCVIYKKNKNVITNKSEFTKGIEDVMTEEEKFNLLTKNSYSDSDSDSESESEEENNPVLDTPVFNPPINKKDLPKETNKEIKELKELKENNCPCKDEKKDEQIIIDISKNDEEDEEKSNEISSFLEGIEEDDKK